MRALPSSLALPTLLATLGTLLAACSSGSGYYTLCDEGSDCDSDLSCYQVAYEEGADGKMCSGECAVDSDCPFGGYCFELVGDPLVGQRVCYEPCDFDVDCPDRFFCQPTINDVTGLPDQSICMPCPSYGCPAP